MAWVTLARGPAGRSSTAPARYPLGRPQHDDVNAGAGDADDGIHELALYERPASTSRPSPTKSAVIVSRSATVMPTWSKRHMRDMRYVLRDLPV